MQDGLRPLFQNIFIALEKRKILVSVEIFLLDKDYNLDYNCMYYEYYTNF